MIMLSRTSGEHRIQQILTTLNSNRRTVLFTQNKLKHTKAAFGLVYKRLI